MTSELPVVNEARALRLCKHIRDDYFPQEKREDEIIAILLAYPRALAEIERLQGMANNWGGIEKYWIGKDREQQKENARLRKRVEDYDEVAKLSHQYRNEAVRLKKRVEELEDFIWMTVALSPDNRESMGVKRTREFFDKLMAKTEPQSGEG